MRQEKRNEILDHMIEISKIIDAKLNTKSQKQENITYYDDLQLGDGRLGIENIYIVKITTQKQKEIEDNSKNKAQSTESDKTKKTAIYEIYDKDNMLIATVSEDGKLHFTPEYLEELKEINLDYFERLNLDDLDFTLPEKLQENDIAMTKEDLKEYEEKSLDKNKEGKSKEYEEEIKDEGEKEEEQGQELEEEKKKQTAEALGIDVSEIKSICTINPREKITDKYNLIDIMPEAEKYDEISIVCSSPNDKGYGRFTMLGVSRDGTTKKEACTPLTSIEPVEGTSTRKDVISVNEDGTEVTEKQVQGLFRINSRGRTDGISVSIGNYGMMDIDYVSNVMDKEHRRATPIRTKGPENIRVPSSQVRENAGDSIEEVEKEGRIFRAREKEGIDPQSLDGIDTDQADGGEMTLEALKEYITERTLEQGDMSKADTREFIESEIVKSGLELSDGEIEHTTNEIEQRVLDESRFPTR